MDISQLLSEKYKRNTNETIYIKLLVMIPSNLHESENVLKKITNTCCTKFAQDLRDCQNCSYRHKGICDEFFEQKFDINKRNLEEGIKIITNSRLDDSEPVLDLKNLFYEIEVNY
ncbi:MAG: hypothetical protein ACFFG0_52640, partial [Candidatus Thorarchaeota archaeon]